MYAVVLLALAILIGAILAMSERAYLRGRALRAVAAATVAALLVYLMLLVILSGLAR